MANRDGFEVRAGLDSNSVSHVPSPSLTRILNEAATYLYMDLDDDPEAANRHIVEWLATAFDKPTAEIAQDLAVLENRVGQRLADFSPAEYEAEEESLRSLWTSRASGTAPADDIQASPAQILPSIRNTDREQSGPDITEEELYSDYVSEWDSYPSISEPAPPVIVPVSPAGVPEMDTYTSYEGMEPVQRTYFDELFVPAVRRGRAPHVDKTEGYGFELLRRTVYEFEEHPIRSRRIVRTLRSDYSDRKLARYAWRVEHDALLAAGDYRSAWQSMRTHDALPLEVYLTLAPDFADGSRVTVADLGRWLAFDRMVSNTGKRLWLAEIENEAQQLLDDYHAAHGRSVILDFWNRLVGERDPGDLAWFHDACDGFADPGLVSSYLNLYWYNYREDPSKARFGTGRWDTHLRDQVQWPRVPAQPYWIRALLQQWQKALFRIAENNVRARHSMPAVGDGWASEAALARQLELAFPDERMVRQGSPKWLRRQRFDIWFPDSNVAVEYQGEQHFRPVALFGGEAGHEETLRRDDQKRRLARENGCTLIEVFPNYDFEYVQATVRMALEKATNASPMT